MQSGVQDFRVVPSNNLQILVVRAVGKAMSVGGLAFFGVVVPRPTLNTEPRNPEPETRNSEH